MSPRRAHLSGAYAPIPIPSASWFGRQGPGCHQTNRSIDRVHQPDEADSTSCAPQGKIGGEELHLCDLDGLRAALGAGLFWQGDTEDTFVEARCNLAFVDRIRNAEGT